ncbi:hypothetical protein EC973_006382 [Apophysomyces ossiformis]|uniref:Peptidase M13 N-terminal domain-containing protein n=1 Tax=Apophysomyces ossiformis TaxID=679940 RepID=A0A8H7BZ73_9FUNG|nr:hypothetical protein EC973_006382 [Apophysomyces ossiformis]
MTEDRAPLLARDRIEDADRRSENSAEAVSTTDYGSGVYRYPLYLQPGQFTSVEKLMFFVSSILLILLFVFVGLYARSSFDDRLKNPLPTPVNPPPETPSLPGNDTKSICMKPRCVLTASYILQDVNPDIDPCDDFYAYTCNNWRNKHILPVSRSKISVQSLLDDAIKQQLRQILTQEFGSSRLDTDQLPSPDNIVDKQLFSKLTDFYRSCMNEDLINRRDISPIYPLFRNIRRYIRQDYRYYHGEDKDGLSQAIAYLGNYDVWPLFKLVIQPDTKTGRESVVISLGDISLQPHEQYGDQAIVNSYTEVTSEILGRLFAKDTGEFDWKQWSPIATARRIVDFEKELVDTLSATERQESYTVDQLQQEAPNVNWAMIIRSMIPAGVPFPRQISVSSSVIHFSKNALVKANSRTLHVYFVWRTLWRYLDALDKEFVEPKRRLDAQITGVKRVNIEPERWETCLAHTNNVWGFLLGRYFTQRNHVVETGQTAEDFVKQIVISFLKRLPQLEWLDEESRKDVEEKARCKRRN